MSAIVNEIVEVCVFRLQEDVPKFLILKRSDDEKLYPGFWQVITGKIREKERAFETALRELYEETQLSPLRKWVIPTVVNFYDVSRDTIQMAPVFVFEVSPNDIPKLSKEHQSFRWVSEEEALAILPLYSQKLIIKAIIEYILNNTESAKLLLITE